MSDSAVEFIATGRSALFENSLYFGSCFQKFTVAQLVNKIVPQPSINLDSPMIIEFFGNVNHRRLVTMLAELSCCLVYEDRNNIIRFVDILGLESGSSDQKADQAEINYQNMFRAPEARLRNPYNVITLSEYTMSTEYRQVSRTEQSPGEITIYFDGPVTGELDFELLPGFALENVLVYTMYMKATLVGTGTAEIIVHGNRVTLTKSEVLYYAPWHSRREPDNPYQVDLPCMIRGEGFEVFRDWFLARRFTLIKMRLETNVSWAQNPALDLGDIMDVQLAKNGSSAPMIHTRQELNFLALKGSSRLIGNNVMR